MVRFLGNLTLRLWILALVAGPVCFYFMPTLTRLFPGLSPKAFATILMVILGLAIGICLNFMGQQWIQGMIRQGKTWERAGLTARAEKIYAKAIHLYATFLLSPWFNRKIARELSEALARFSLTSGRENQVFKIATAVYLKSYPQDETLAALWLGQRKKQGIGKGLEQEVLTALVDVHYAHKKLVFLLADVLLDQGRMDYSAKRLYQNLLDDPELASGLAVEAANNYRQRIRILLGEPEKIMETGFGARAIPIEKKFAARSIPIPGHGQRRARQRPSFFRMTFGVLKSLAMAPVAGLGFLVRFPGKAITYARGKEKLGLYLRLGFMGVVSVWLLFFLGNTFFHLLKTKVVEKSPAMVEVQVPKPFTIQVAAYLEKAHADRYVAILNKKNLEAVIKTVVGGGKTWYVVRISEFPDKITATEFGNKLKTQKLIDDFFVSNQ